MGQGDNNRKSASKCYFGVNSHAGCAARSRLPPPSSREISATARWTDMGSRRPKRSIVCLIKLRAPSFFRFKANAAICKSRLRSCMSGDRLFERFAPRRTAPMNLRMSGVISPLPRCSPRGLPNHHTFGLAAGNGYPRSTASSRNAPQRHHRCVSLRLRAIVRPCLHELAPLLKEIAAPVCGLDCAPDRMRQRLLDHVVRVARALGCPIAKAGPKAVHGDVGSPHALQHAEHCLGFIRAAPSREIRTRCAGQLPYP